MFELILNILLLIGLGYTMAFHVVEAPVPMKVQKNPYALQPGVWPNVLIVILMVLIVINIIGIIKNNRGKESFSLKAFAAGIPAFFTGKLFLGIAVVVIASFLLEPLGFMMTCFLFLIGYGLLLGEKKYLRLVLVSAVVTVFLYVVFGVLLAVNLPRGTVPFLRNFALAIESILQ